MTLTSTDKPRRLTQLQAVHSVLTRYNYLWLTPIEIKSELTQQDLMISDSSVGSRIRDLRMDRYGGHNIAIRRRKGSTQCEYQLKQESLL